MTGISAIWSAGGFTDPGPSIFAAVLFVIFLIFGVAAVIALATAKIGLSLVVAVGPLMVVGLLFRSTQEYFTKWLSYGVQFAFLAMFVGGIAGMADAIVDTYIDALDDSAETVDLVALMAPALMLLLLAKIFAELPNMASSLSGGIGLSIGNTAWRGMQGLMNQAGGKHIDAWRDAARWRRVRGAEALHERMVEMRRAAVDRLLHGSNQGLPAGRRHLRSRLGPRPGGPRSRRGAPPSALRSLTMKDEPMRIPDHSPGPAAARRLRRHAEGAERATNRPTAA